MGDPVRNFAITTVTTAPSPASSGTTLEPDDAALFPDPDVDGAFNAIVWPTGTQPLATNAEIIRVQGLAAGVWDPIDREQEATDARSIIAGDQVMLGPTAKTISDLDVVRRVTRSISPAELLDLVNTPIELAPAPGEGRVNTLLAGTAGITFVTTPYGGVEGLNLVLGSTTDQVLHLFTLTGESADSIEIFGTEELVASFSGLADQPLTLVGDLTDGDSPIVVSVVYAVADVT